MEVDAVSAPGGGGSKEMSPANNLANVSVDEANASADKPNTRCSMSLLTLTKKG